MSMTDDPATVFLRERLLPLAGAGDVFAGPDPALPSYFSECPGDPDGDVRDMPEDVAAMLELLAARWQAEGRDDLAALAGPLRELAAALLEQADDGEAPATPAFLMQGR